MKIKKWTKLKKIYKFKFWEKKRELSKVYRITYNKFEIFLTSNMIVYIEKNIVIISYDSMTKDFKLIIEDFCLWFNYRRNITLLSFFFTFHYFFLKINNSKFYHYSTFKRILLSVILWKIQVFNIYIYIYIYIYIM